MKRQTKFWMRGIALCCLAVTSSAQAQVTSDGTLSTKVKTTNNRDFTITNGNRAGTNLFHSFEQFSVPKNGVAYFNNADDIQNIISRVTGSYDSRIDGLLKAEGTANLFLLNPKGIIFGPNASLDIGGSFLASTASSLNFGNDTRFSATAPQANPLLSVKVPIGLQFGAVPKRIVNRSRALDTGLQVQPGKTLALVGGDVTLEGGNLTAVGGQIELGGVAEAGTVGLDVDGDTLGLGFPDSVGRADVSLTNGAYVDVADGRGGSIAINAQNLDVLGGSVLQAGLGSSSGFLNSQPQDITLNATGAIRVEEGSLIFNNPEAIGKGGDITIQAKSLSLTDDVFLKTSTSGQGDAGDISVRASESVSLNNGFISTAGGKGKAGDITIQAKSLSLTERASLSSTTAGQGDAGKVTIKANTVSFEEGGVFSRVEKEKAEGSAGDITIETGSLSVKDGAQLIVNTSGTGDAGNVTINARKSVSLEGMGENSEGKIIPSQIKASVLKGAEGNAGNIDITTGSLFATDGSQLVVSASGTGDAGNVRIKARDTVFLDGMGKEGGIRASVLEGAEGKAGKIDITTGSLFVKGGARIATNTFAQGNAGRVRIDADTVSFDGVASSGRSSGAYSFLGQEANGKEGNINITTDSLSVRNGAILIATNDAKNSQGIGGNIFLDTKTFEALGGGQVLTTTRGPGKAGKITLKATDSVILKGSDPDFLSRPDDPTIVFNQGANSGLFANTSAIDEETPTGSGGNLTINTRQLTVQDGAEVSASTAGSGRGGTLTVIAPESITLSGKGGLFAQATANGDAGSLTINTQKLTVEDGAEVSAKTTSGQGGNIKLEGLNSLQVRNGEISASTATGRAGFLSVDAAKSVELSGNKDGLSVEATKGGTAGSLTIGTELLTVQDGAAVTVSSPEGQAGNLTITADTVRLSNGKLNAETGAKPGEAAREGANINLQGLDLLLLQNGSLISAEATGVANGGNINIIKNTANSFIIATPGEDSDIIAKASAGRGGKIEIETQGLFGIKERRAIEGNRTNDIDASSEFGLEGDVTINTPDVDPNQGLVALPQDVIDTSGLIAQGCSAGVGAAASKFVVTGRGGLPPIPRETVSSETILEDWGKRPLASAQSQPTQSRLPEHSRQAKGPENHLNTPATSTPGSISAPIVEAQGWVTGPNGEVVLTAQAPTVTPHSPGPSTPDCLAAP